MKFLIASDIHGDIDCAEQLICVFKNEGCDKLILLGDLLYHGPRNDLPKSYAPKKVIELLNEYKNDIISVRGNCDTEVDQMVLDFPILSDYSYIFSDGISIFATHGHKYNSDNLPPLKHGDVIIHGHTHVLCAKKMGNSNYLFNPGSTTLPKDGNPRTYMIYEKRAFTIKDFDGNIVIKKTI